MSIYIIRCTGTGLYKIGHAKDPKARLANLQIGSASYLHIALTMDGDFAAERALHGRYDSVRQQGEWFALRAEHLAPLIGSGTLGLARASARIDLSRLAAMSSNSSIAALVARVFEVRDEGGKSFCPNAVWYGRPGHLPGLKREVRSLVGWHGETSFKTSDDYSTLYRYLYDLLPGCRSCGCAVIEAEP